MDATSILPFGDLSYAVKTPSDAIPISFLSCIRLLYCHVANGHSFTRKPLVDDDIPVETTELADFYRSSGGSPRGNILKLRQFSKWVDKYTRILREQLKVTPREFPV